MPCHTCEPPAATLGRHASAMRAGRTGDNPSAAPVVVQAPHLVVVCGWETQVGGGTAAGKGRTEDEGGCCRRWLYLDTLQHSTCPQPTASITATRSSNIPTHRRIINDRMRYTFSDSCASSDIASTRACLRHRRRLWLLNRHLLLNLLDDGTPTIGDTLLALVGIAAVAAVTLQFTRFGDAALVLPVLSVTVC